MTYGPEVADLADSVGMTLDREQRLALDYMYAIRKGGQLAAQEFGLVCARQNLKSHVLEAAALADLVLFAEPESLWTAHLMRTSTKAFVHLKALFTNYDHLRRLGPRFSETNGEEGVRLRSGANLDFMARGAKAGRGLSGNRVTLDEALYLSEATVGALLPTLSAKTMSGVSVQIRYAGSAGTLESAVWRKIRRRGRAGDELALGYLEWAAPLTPCQDRKCRHVPGTAGCALDRPDLLKQANPALYRRIALDYVLTTERAALTPVEYMRERFSWWQDPPNDDGETVGDLDLDAWRDLTDPSAEPRRPMVLGVDQGEDRSVAIGCAWRRPNRQSVQIMLSQVGPGQVDVGLSPDAAVDRIAQLRRTWRCRVILGGPAVGLERALKDKNVPVEVLTGEAFARACGALDDRLHAGTLCHGGQPELTSSIRVAQWRAVGVAGERAFRLKDAPGVSPTAAVVRALAGVLDRGVTPPAAPQAVPAGGDSPLLLSSMQF